MELCEKASDPDWLYLGLGPVLTAAAIYFDGNVKYSDPFSRLLAPTTVGLAWGFTLGSIYPALPKCSPNWVPSSPPEGNVRNDWQLAVAFAALSALTAPIIVATETGAADPKWTDEERAARVLLPAAAGAIGSLIPYLLPPKTWRAAEELQHLRASATPDGKGAFFGWQGRF